MWKKALRVTTTLGLLLAGYAGYSQGFAHFARWIGTPRNVPLVPYDPSPARTEREALELAERAFGTGHWTTDRENRTCYYDAGRGFWFFFQDYARVNGGRQLRFSPFALIRRSSGKENLNSIVANEALVDFDKPFDIAPGAGDPPQVVHAIIEGEVHLRDDKGTLDNAADDLTIGPLTHLEFDEATHSIQTTSRVAMREADLVANATGMTIKLRPSPPPADRPDAKSAGYSGAETIWLLEDITIAVKDVGNTGLVPGAGSSTEQRPGDLTCDGPARIDLPAPRLKTDPPGPERPIIAEFHRNVRLRQGDPDLPDQCNADALRLTLLPADSGNSVAAEVEKLEEEVASGTIPTEEELKKDETETDGRLSGLVLSQAEATGHAVWVQSPSQGLKARGNELRYKRNAPAEPDVIYFRGDTYTLIEKTTLVSQGTQAGEVLSLDTIRTKDVTIRRSNDPAVEPTVIAQGPGLMETRPRKGGPVERSASWNDRLEMETVSTQVGPRRRVELTGAPTLKSPTQGWLEADGRIVAFLKPKAQSEGETAATAASETNLSDPASAAFQIDWMEAYDNVRMQARATPMQSAAPAPAQDRDILAREKLNIVFTQSDPETTAAEPRNPALASGGIAPPPGDPKAPVIPALPSQSPNPEAGDKTAEAGKAQNVRVEADEVWAKVLLGNAQDQPVLHEVQLLRKVHLHQDPEPGRSRGTDVTGDLVIYQNRGADQAWVEAQGTLDTPARVETDAFLIEGPRMILDQAADFAQVIGPGRLRQEGANALNPVPVIRTAYQDGEATPAPATPQKLSTGGPVEIQWEQEMNFYGQPMDPSGRPSPAWALFVGRVRAWSFDPVKRERSIMTCDKMRALMDQPLAFRRPEAQPPTADPKLPPRIVLVHCLKNVILEHQGENPRTGELLQAGKLVGPDVWYNLASGRFVGQGPGILRLYRTKQPDAPAESEVPPPAAPLGGLPRNRTSARSSTDARIIRTAADDDPPPARQPRLPEPSIPAPARRAPAPDRLAARDRQSPPGMGADLPSGGPFDLTRVEYRKSVEGRFAADRAESPNTPWMATFKGGVQVLSAKVPDAKTDINPDRPPTKFMFVAAEVIDIVREVPPPGADPDVQDQFFIDAHDGKPMGRDENKAIFGDRITYDSVKELVYVYGDKSGVTIANQDAAGQPFSASRGQAVMFNRRDGQIKFIEPQNVLLIDPRSGIRARPVAPGQVRDNKPKPVTAPPIRVPASDRERKGFTGR